MLAKPESGTPDCNKLTIKEKDDMKDVPLLMVQLSYPSWYTDIQRNISTDTHMTTRQPKFFRSMGYQSHTAMKVIGCIYSTVYLIDKTFLMVKYKTG